MSSNNVHTHHHAYTHTHRHTHTHVHTHTHTHTRKLTKYLRCIKRRSVFQYRHETTNGPVYFYKVTNSFTLREVLVNAVATLAVTVCPYRSLQILVTLASLAVTVCPCRPLQILVTLTSLAITVYPYRPLQILVTLASLAVTVYPYRPLQILVTLAHWQLLCVLVDLFNYYSSSSLISSCAVLPCMWTS